MGVSVILKVQPIQYDTYIVFVIWKLLKLHTGPGNMEIWKTMQFRHNKAQKIKKKKTFRALPVVGGVRIS